MLLGRIFEIPVRINWSWLVLFGLLVWTLSSSIGPLGAVPVQWRLGAAVLTVLVLFACVVVHELAHALVARKAGIKTREIVLFVFGGVSRMERPGADAASEIKIAVAGPAVSIALGLLFAVVAALMPADSPALRIFTYLALVNVALAAFNLLPLYPIDGGRIVHSIAWNVTHDRARATKIALTISSGAGAVLACIGIAMLFFGYTLSGVWLLLLAWFISRMAQAEHVSESAIEPLRSLRCGDLADPPGDPIASGTPCDSALTQMIAHRRRAAPVLEGKRLLGVCTLRDFAKVAGTDAKSTSVNAIMTPLDHLKRLAPETDALAALAQLSESEFHQLPVVSERDEFVGFVSAETLQRAVAFSLETERLGVGAYS